jgi:hypothetical protein
MTSDPGRGTVPCQLTRYAPPSQSALDRHADDRALADAARIPRECLSTTPIPIQPRPIAPATSTGAGAAGHAQDIAVEKTGQ